MGGHGALTLYLKNPGLFKSVSAFAPISNPSLCPWGDKAFSGYLGADREEWKRHDATELVQGAEWRGKDLRALIDVGTGDNFYKQGQLLPENFEAAIREAGVTGVTVRYQEVRLLSCVFRALVLRIVISTTTIPTISSQHSPKITSTTPLNIFYDHTSDSAYPYLVFAASGWKKRNTNVQHGRHGLTS
ncbi:hypothetical protein NUW58_g10856 [Xylaria curta]|uniref:Uncharacterized protein n=1 Tax=Xylaria curta TaxID=42375 RepID=A0ACC1MFI3_9PEZI|nr:hypothetical protein NUW58_g10856 [Xylaria curta]